ncbi:hypothetical protein ADP71_40630 [Vitreoscilla sp. C1]|nr:hypothetical protein ADP71_40630 [Vitreoscilla sp. C1]
MVRIIPLTIKSGCLCHNALNEIGWFLCVESGFRLVLILAIGENGSLSSQFTHEASQNMWNMLTICMLMDGKLYLNSVE